MVGEHIGLDVGALLRARIVSDPRLDDGKRRVDEQQGKWHTDRLGYRTETVAQETVREGVVDHDTAAVGDRRPRTACRHQAGLLPLRIGDYLAAIEAALDVDRVVGDQLGTERGGNLARDRRLAGEREAAGGYQFTTHFRTLPKCTAR